jgi:hypothetical protein
MPDELWIKILHHVIHMQEMDNRELLAKGESRRAIRFPTRVATGLALVCKKEKGRIFYPTKHKYYMVNHGS